MIREACDATVRTREPRLKSRQSRNPRVESQGEYVFHVFRLYSVCSGNVRWFAEVLGATGSGLTSD